MDDPSPPCHFDVVVRHHAVLAFLDLIWQPVYGASNEENEFMRHPKVHVRNSFVPVAHNSLTIDFASLLGLRVWHYDQTANATCTVYGLVHRRVALGNTVPCRALSIHSPLWKFVKSLVGGDS